MTIGTPPRNCFYMISQKLWEVSVAKSCAKLAFKSPNCWGNHFLQIDFGAPYFEANVSQFWPTSLDPPKKDASSFHRRKPRVQIIVSRDTLQTILTADIDYAHGKQLKMVESSKAYLEFKKQNYQHHYLSIHFPQCPSTKKTTQWLVCAAILLLQRWPAMVPIASNSQLFQSWARA